MVHLVLRNEEETMDHSKHVRLSATEFNADTLEGATIYGPGDDKIGSVSHIHGAGPTAQVVIDVGGFLGIGAKPVAVPASELDFMRDDDGEVHALTSWTKDQLKAMPEHIDP
jgi:ribosomal 30S subunit maturation factor RimM